MAGVMDDGMLRSIYSSADETLAQLDRLLSQNREREREVWRMLRDATDRLSEASAPYPDDDSAGQPSPAPPPPRRAGEVAAETPYVALPQRTTHGGSFGPAVRRKLIAEALAKGNVW